MSKISGNQNQTTQSLAITVNEVGVPNQTFLFFSLTLFASCGLTVAHLLTKITHCGKLPNQRHVVFVETPSLTIAWHFCPFASLASCPYL